MMGHLGYMFDNYPRTTAVMLAFWVIAFLAILIYTPWPDGPEAQVALDKAHLECRQSGGNFEYFRSQGYVCIRAALPKGDEK